MGRPLLAEPVLERARAASEAFALCDHCLGRLAAKVETGHTNDARGRLIRNAIGTHEVASAACDVCQGLFDEVDLYVDLVVEALAPYEYDTFLVGTRIDPLVADAEAEVHELVGDDTAEPVNTEMNREVGRRVFERLGKDVDFRAPHVTAIVDTRFHHVTLTHSGLFIFGRYRKHVRDLPQTKWPCRSCSGHGCVDCGGEGQRYPSSVQELVQAPALEMSGATEASFHGAGREDVDARCLGDGRPFILELKDPRRRSLDLDDLARRIADDSDGRVAVRDLRVTDRAEVKHVKASSGRKTYEARVAFSHPVAKETLLKGIELLRQRPVVQRTPTRVAHRRADKDRRRRVIDATLASFEEKAATLRITGDAGLYIKELVSGDGGRTTPSVSALVGADAVVQELDIVHVDYQPPGDTTKR